jgi:hypothetical protein
MASHQLKLDAQGLQLTGKDLEITVHSSTSDYKLGTLKISKGSLDWRDGHDKLSHVLTWEQFADLAKAHGSKKKRR